MKLNKLFLLMLALPMALVACKNSDAPKVESEYLFDVKMANAERMSEIAEEGITFEDNQFFIAFTDKNESHMLTLLIQGEEGETTLSAGTYTSARGAVVLDGSMLATKDGTVYPFAGGEASVTVALSDAKGYTIEAIMTDANGNKYRFTYEGEIRNMKDNAIVLDYAERHPSNYFDLEDNYFAIMFNDRFFTYQLGIVIIGAEGEDILSAGTYTIENGGIFADGCETSLGTKDYNFSKGNVVVVVDGDINGYTFDIKASDDKGNSFHFKYEGKVRNMNPKGDALPILEGFSYGINEYNTYGYTIILSDKSWTSENLPQSNSQNYAVRIFSNEESVADAEGYTTVPFGTYEFDAKDTHANGTFCVGHSGYIVAGEGDIVATSGGFQSGVVTITEEGIEIDGIINEQRHHVVYNGYPKFLDRSAK